MLFKNVINSCSEFGSDEEAMEYANAICEYDSSDQEIGYHRYVGTTNGVEVHYDYGADYYFFVDVTDEQ